MAWEKVFSRRNWQNEPSTATPINETNLNAGDSALDTIDDRVVALDSRVDTLEGYEPRVIGYAQAAETSKLNSEAYAVGTRDGVDVTSGDAAYHNNSKYYSEQAGTSATGAATSKSDSEAYAVGTRSGTPVTSGDATYHNNSKYYSEQATACVTASAGFASNAEDSAEDSEAWAVGKRNGVDVSSSDDTYHNNSKYYSEQSGSHVEDAEAWATGKRGGVDVGSSDETYHNNSKYYKEQAATSATNASASATEAESYAKGGTNTRTGEDTDNADYYRGLAATSASNASSSATLSESWAVGGTSTRTGEDTNNSSYYATQSGNHSLDSEAYAVGKRNGTDVTSGDVAYHNNAKYYSENAEACVTASANFASASEDSAEDSEAWAVGQRAGVDVPLTDETYHNNAKYWAAQAESAAAGGVSSFNGRSGFVTPLADDYSIDMITPTTGAAEGKLVGVDANGELNAIYDGGHKILNENGTQFTQRSKLKFLNAEVTDDSTNDTTIVTVQGGGVALSDVTGATITTVKRSVSITWTDPTDVIVDGTTLATWAGTIVVRKKGSAPQNKMDGTQIVDETVRNTYSSSALTDTLDYDGTYYYRFFPYSTTGSVTKGSSVTSTPERVAITTVPSPSTVTYNGTSQSPTWSNYDSNELTIGGTTSGTNAGTYTATFTPTYDYKWSDDSASKSVNWTIDKASVTPPTVTNTSKTYNGSSQSVTVSAYDSNVVSVTGTSATNVGSYTVTMSLIDTSNSEWSDTTTADKTVSWSISKLELAVPTQSGSLVFDNTPQLPTWSGYDSDYMTKTETAQTAVGTYSTTFALIDTDNTKFVGTDNTSVSVSWSINDAVVEPPTVTNTSLTYNRSSQGPTISTYDSSIITITGATATNAGNYTLTMSLAANYKWTDTTTADKTVSWSISPKSVTAPSVSGSFTYDGTQKSATVSSYDSNEIVQSGDDSGTNAGTYTIYFDLSNSTNYIWSDSTTAQKSATWSIAKANASVTVSKASVSLTTSKLYEDVTITATGDGTLSVTSSNTSAATVTNTSGSTYRITAIANGSATITASVPATTNYNAASATISVSVSLVDSVLNNNSWSAIKSVSNAGNASSYWSVGDKKSITLNGTVGTKSYSNVTVYVFIIDFNHNSSVEGSGISFGSFKTSNGTDICLDDDTYGSNAGASGAKKFAMNHWGSSSSPYNTNYGGWAACDLRYDILGSTNVAPSPYGSTKTTSATGSNPTSTCTSSPVSNTLMATLPSDLRSEMKAITKYTDNKGNSSNSSANVTATIDYLPLMSEYELQGARTYANEYEKNSQVQYAYYANGNSKVKNKQSDGATAAYWWLRSPTYNTAYDFCCVYTDGSANYIGSRVSYGLSPVFLI